MFAWEEEHPYFFSNFFVSFFLLFYHLSNLICERMQIDNEYIAFVFLAIMGAILAAIFIVLSKIFDKHYIFEWQREYGYEYNRYIFNAKSSLVTPLPYLIIQTFLVYTLVELANINTFVVIAISIAVAFVLDVLIMSHLPWFFKHKFLLKEKDFDNGSFIKQPKQ